jgi:hypothetical protein
MPAATGNNYATHAGEAASRQTARVAPETRAALEPGDSDGAPSCHGVSCNDETSW